MSYQKDFLIKRYTTSYRSYPRTSPLNLLDESQGEWNSKREGWRVNAQGAYYGKYGSCSVPTLLTPKKDESWRIRYRFLLHRLDDVLIGWEARAYFRRLTSGVDTIKSALDRETNRRKLSRLRRNYMSRWSNYSFKSLRDYMVYWVLLFQIEIVSS